MLDRCSGGILASLSRQALLESRGPEAVIAKLLKRRVVPGGEVGRSKSTQSVAESALLDQGGRSLQLSFFVLGFGALPAIGAPGRATLSQQLARSSFAESPHTRKEDALTRSAPRPGGRKSILGNVSGSLQARTRATSERQRSAAYASEIAARQTSGCDCTPP